MDLLLPVMADASAPLRTAIRDALSTSSDYLEHANRTRWSLKPGAPATSDAQRREALDALRSALIDFRTKRRLAVLAPFERYFDPASGAFVGDEEKARLSGRSLYLCFALATNLRELGTACVRLLDKIEELEQKRKKRRLWWPKGLRKIGKLLVGGKGAKIGDGLAAGEDPERVEALGDESDEETLNSKKGKKQEKKVADDAATLRDPDAKIPHTAIGKFGRGLFRTYMWFWSPEVCVCYFFLMYDNHTAAGGLRRPIYYR
jgi:hypothetical protein